MLHHLKDHVSVTAHPPSRAQGTPFETRLSECILSSMHEGAGPFVRFKLSYILYIYIYQNKKMEVYRIVLLIHLSHMGTQAHDLCTFPHEWGCKEAHCQAVCARHHGVGLCRLLPRSADNLFQVCAVLSLLWLWLLVVVVVVGDHNDGSIRHLHRSSHASSIPLLATFKTFSRIRIAGSTAEASGGSTT